MEGQYRLRIAGGGEMAGMIVRGPSVHLPAVRFDSDQLPRHPIPSSLPLLSLSKPSWVIRTESNVRKEQWKKPNPPCELCLGSGRVDCYDCHGRGRTNCVHLDMLPSGEWPKWCKTCRGSGLGYCSRCVGTGEYRYIMGFHFMKKESGDKPNPRNYEVREYSRTKPAGDVLINEGQGSSPSSS